MKSILIFSILINVLYGAPPLQESYESLSVFAEKKISMIRIVHPQPVAIDFGVIEGVDAVKTPEMRDALKAQAFPASWRDISYQKWRSYFSENAFPDEASAIKSYQQAKEKFPTVQSYKEDRIFSKLGRRTLLQELQIGMGKNSYYILVLAGDGAGRSTFKFFVKENRGWKICGKAPAELSEINFPWNITDVDMAAWASGCALSMENGELIFSNKKLPE